MTSKDEVQTGTPTGRSFLVGHRPKVIIQGPGEAEKQKKARRAHLSAVGGTSVPKLVPDAENNNE